MAERRRKMQTVTPARPAASEVVTMTRISPELAAVFEDVRAGEAWRSFLDQYLQIKALEPMIAKAKLSRAREASATLAQLEGMKFEAEQAIKRLVERWQFKTLE